MTTLGVSQMQAYPRPASLPRYSYQPPQRYQLTAVKDGIYHPCIPTFRRMAMDTEMNKLPDEHSQTSTRCNRQDFLRTNYDAMEAPRQPLHCMNITDTGRALHKYYTTPEELRSTREGWSEFLTRCPERYEIKLPDIPPARDMHYVGYGVRYLRPDLSRDILMKMRTEPALDKFNIQRPVPALDLARHRSEPHPPHSRSISSRPFRPTGHNNYRMV